MDIRGAVERLFRGERAAHVAIQNSDPVGKALIIAAIERAQPSYQRVPDEQEHEQPPWESLLR